MTPPYLAALDLGQVSDPTALAIAERKLVQFGNVQEQHYYVRHLERFPLGTPYGGRCIHGVVPKQPCLGCPLGLSIGGIVEQLRTRLLHLPVPEAWYRAVPVSLGSVAEFPRQELPYELLIDYTGVGRGVADMFTSRDVWPICLSITAGNAVTEPERGIWHIAKRQLMSPLQVVLQTRRLHVINNEPGQALMQEAINFKYRLNTSANGEEQYATWRENKHDDLLFAVAMLCWWGERSAPLFDGASDGTTQFAVPTGNPLFTREGVRG